MWMPSPTSAAKASGRHTTGIPTSIMPCKASVSAVHDCHTSATRELTTSAPAVSDVIIIIGSTSDGSQGVPRGCLYPTGTNALVT